MRRSRFDAQVDETAMLGGRVRLFQPAQGYRVAIDPVFLAAAVPDGPWTSALDVGTGTGAAMLCLAARREHVHCSGVELLADHASLAERSVYANGWQNRLSIVRADVRDRRACPSLVNTFDQVLTNPPFHGPGRQPEHFGRLVAHREHVPLEDWLAFCLRMIRPHGGLTLIYRADRLDDLLAAIHTKVGTIEIFPLWPYAGRAAKRVIVRARKGTKRPTVLHPGLVLHQADGSFTAQADAILRGGLSLDEALSRS